LPQEERHERVPVSRKPERAYA